MEIITSSVYMQRKTPIIKGVYDTPLMIPHAKKNHQNRFPGNKAKANDSTHFLYALIELKHP